MKVYVYPADLGGCGYYRLIWPAKRLAQLGYDVKLVHPKQSQKLTGGTDADGKLVQISMPKDADVMVFQRVTSKMIVDGIKIMRANGVAVVLDVDDDMSAIHPSNPAWAALHPSSSALTSEYDWNSAIRACEEATYVTVSTDALMNRYVKHGRGQVLRNCIPEILTRIERKPTQDVFGWGGSMHSHPDDPQVVGSSMGRLYREGYKFRVVGPPYGIKTAFQLDEDPQATGPIEIENWPHELTKLSVGLAPLAATRFNEAKSWLKMLEYAAVGVPCVGSPRAEYRKLHAMGVGLLADNPKQWYRHVKNLLQSDSMRNEMAAAGRDAIRTLTIEENAWRWAEAWDKALGIQRGPLNVKTAVS